MATHSSILGWTEENLDIFFMDRGPWSDTTYQLNNNNSQNSQGTQYQVIIERKGDPLPSPAWSGNPRTESEYHTEDSEEAWQDLFCQWWWWWFSAKSSPTLCNPVDCNPPGSSLYGISQARILKWAAFPFPGDLPDPGIKPTSPTLQADYHSATREAPLLPEFQESSHPGSWRLCNIQWKLFYRKTDTKLSRNRWSRTR